MNDTAVLIAVAYSVVVVLGVVGAVLVWSSTRGRRESDPARLARLAERERTWFFVVVALLLALLLATIFFVPYGGGSAEGTVRTVDVTAAQFSWKLDPPTVPAGLPVEFVIRSEDVNHGFGVYDPDRTFLFQVQAMPTKVQRYTYTFTKPGEYEILCMEFCGVLHHRMIGRFEVRG